MLIGDVKISIWQKKLLATILPKISIFDQIFVWDKSSIFDQFFCFGQNFDF